MDTSQISNMKCGIFKGRSYHNYGPSVLKSGVCKYFRRGIFDKFRWCVVEMLLFGMAPDSAGKGLVTNITNRLKILVMEEIVFYDIGDIVACIDIINKLSSEENIENKIKLSLEFCSVVEQFKRARLVSYVNNWWKFKSDISGWDVCMIEDYTPPDNFIPKTLFMNYWVWKNCESSPDNWWLSHPNDRESYINLDDIK